MRAVTIIGGVAVLLALLTPNPSTAPAAAGPGEIAFDRAGWIYVARADGSGVRRLIRGGGAAFSPDGSRVAFTRFDRLYVANADGTREQQLTRAGRGYDIEWSTTVAAGATYELLPAAPGGSGSSAPSASTS